MSTTDHRLSRLMDAPSFARIVPHLAPETLQQLIHLRGLDACGELVIAATPEQLTSLLDLDLWRNAQPGRDEQFDVERFGEWLEVLVDTGESVAARTVAALDRQIVIAGLSRYIRVFDPGTFEPHESSDDEAIERHDRMNSETGRDVLECELGGYTVRARRTDAWDAIVALLLTLECWPDAALLPDAFLKDHDLVRVFEVGWSTLYRDVSLFVTDQLISTLTDVRRFDTDTRLSLLTFQRALEKNRQVGTPWLARDAADVLAMLDMTAWVSVRGLLDECPILPASLSAMLERSTTLVSPTAFEFFSTKAQIGEVRLFMRTLPSVLSR